MIKFNYRKIILLFADVFIIVVSGIVLNYVLSLTKVISAEASGMLLYYLVINILTCELMMLLFGSYSRIWRYFNIRDYIMCAAGMTSGFVVGYGVLFLINMKPHRFFFILYYLIATVGVLLFRFLFKSTFLELTRFGESTPHKRTMIVGAGQAGRMILTEIHNAQNDSKNPYAAHKDRHEKLGEGCIGLEALVAVVNHPTLKDLPFYLETPHDDLAGYANEIAVLKEARNDVQ